MLRFLSWWDCYSISILLQWYMKQRKTKPPQHISLTSARHSTSTSAWVLLVIQRLFLPQLEPVWALGLDQMGLDAKGNFVSYSLQSPQEVTALRHIQTDVALCLYQDPFLESIQLSSRLKASSPVKICLEKYFKILKSKVTFPMPGLSLILDTALRRHGGAGGGQSCRMPLKLVA